MENQKNKKVNQTEQLYNRTINANKKRIEVLDMLYSNDWNVTISIHSELDIPASTIKERLQDTLKQKGFPASTYKLLVVAKNHGIYGYAEAFPDAEGNSQVQAFVDAVYSMTGLYSISCFEHDRNQGIMDITNDGEYTKVLRTNNVTVSKINFTQIVRFFIDEFAQKRKGSSYTQNFELKGSMKNKKVMFYPTIDGNGNGYVWFFVNEYNKKQLQHSYLGVMGIENYTINPSIYSSKLGHEALFVYLIFTKPDYRVAYIGVTEKFETRIKRHFAPTESYVNNTSVPFNYDFWLKHGVLPVTDANLQLFRKHRLNNDEYEAKLLPLTHYNQYVQIPSAKKKKLLPEAYVMNAIFQEVPNRIIYAEKEMQFFCNTIIHKANDVPLWHSTSDLNQTRGYDNVNKYQVDRSLDEFSDIVNGQIECPTGTTGETTNRSFDEVLRLTLMFLRATQGKEANILDASWYDLFKDHALTFEEAVRYAVGVTLDEVSNNDHKEAIVQHILTKANYNGGVK